MQGPDGVGTRRAAVRPVAHSFHHVEALAVDAITDRDDAVIAVGPWPQERAINYQQRRCPGPSRRLIVTGTEAGDISCHRTSGTSPPRRALRRFQASGVLPVVIAVHPIGELLPGVEAELVEHILYVPFDGPDR
ncbi:hypothetical protein GCM10023197_05130 [Gordonia humi]